MLVGFYSCCIFNYDFIVYMLHSINSGLICFNYFVCECMFCIAYGVLCMELNAAHCFSILFCSLYECCKPTEGMEGVVRSVKFEGWGVGE